MILHEVCRVGQISFKVKHSLKNLLVKKKRASKNNMAAGGDSLN